MFDSYRRRFQLTKLRTVTRFRIWMDYRFHVRLNSPDGHSGRTLIFITRPNKNPFKGIKITSWCHGENRSLERLLNKLGLFPSW